MDAPSEIVFEVPGQPVPQPRHKVTARGRFAHAYIKASHPIHVYREAVALAAIEAVGGQVAPSAGPLVVDIEAIIERPQSHWKKSGLTAKAPAWPPRCDWDNLAKGVCDALTGVLWIDDDQVVDGRCRKRYAERGQAGRTVVRVRSL